jgi:octaprenyl-diphosphate synthase
MRNASKEDSELIADAIRKGDASQLPGILQIVQTTGGMTYTLDCARQHVNFALDQVSKLENNPYTQAMKELAEFSLARSY